MPNLVICVEHLSKAYHLGQIGSGTFANDMKIWWARARGKPNPLLRVGESDFGNRDGEEIWALKDISFKVEQGEVLGIIGRNGAGKSTLLKILSRVTAPTAGKIKVKGRVASLLEVGTGFHPELTGRENVYLNGAILGMNRKEIDQKYDAIVDFAEVEKFIDTPVKRYSSGMYVRLAFAVAAHLDPEILVVDEVLAVGDAEFQKKCLGKMGEVAKEGRTVLFVSHNMGAIINLCSRSVLLQSGIIECDGMTELVIREYLKLHASAIPLLTFEPIDSQAYFTSVGLLDMDLTPSTSFDIRKPIYVMLGMVSKRLIRENEVTISVHNFRGDRIFFSSSALAGVNLGVEAPGIHNLLVKIPAKLLPPGEYYLNIGIHQPHIRLYDRKENILTFEINETGSDRSKFTPQQMGYVLVDLEWQRINKEPMGSNI